MGKKASYIKERLGEIHRRKVARGKHSEKLRLKRHGDDTSSRLIQRVMASKPLPEPQDRLLLLEQFDQACRLPKPAEDLRRLLQQNLVDSHLQKEQQTFLKQIVEKMLSHPSLDEVVRDECGSKVLNALVGALQSAHLEKEIGDLTNVLLCCFERDASLLRHHVGCVSMSAVALNAGKLACERILKIFETSFVTIEEVLEMITERHAASVFLRLLTVYHDPSAHWLSVALRITPSENPQKKKKARKEEGESRTSAEADLRGLLLRLLDNPVSAPVVHQLVSDENRLTIFTTLGFSSLCSSKRASKFLIRLLELDSPTLATQLLETIFSDEGCVTTFVDSATDSVANFTCQKVIELLVKVPENKSLVLFRRVLELLTPKLTEMAHHGIGVHVVVCFIDVASKLHEKSKAVKQIADQLCRPENTLEMIRNKHGSLVVRKLIEACAAHPGTAGLLFSTVEQHMTTLMYDATGNLIVQQLLRSGGPQAANAFFKKYLRGENLVAAAQHPSASHVVFTLLDCVDPQSLTELCGSLKPHVAQLAKHVNGRFIVEKILPLQRDIREALLRQFVPLSMAKGTQHLLLALMNAADQTTRQNLIQNILLPQFRSLATNAVSTIVLQKLLQGSPVFLDAVRKYAAREAPTLLRDISQDFYGKFVAQIVNS